MTTTMKMLEFYAGAWEMLGFSVSSDGFIRRVNEKDDQFEQLVYEDKPVVLPYPEQLQPGLAERVIFNPVLEDIDKAESNSLAAYREQVIHAMNQQAMNIMISLLAIAFDPNQASNMTEEQLDFLRPLAQWNVKPDKLLASLEGLLRKSRAKTERSIVGFYLKRMGEIGSKRYRSVGVVSFPMLEELIACEDTPNKAPFGVKLSKDERGALREILTMMYPDPESESWMAGSDDPFAPKLSSLAKAMYIVLQRNVKLGLMFSGLMTLKNEKLYTSENVLNLMMDTRPLEMERRYFRGVGDFGAPVSKEKQEMLGKVASGQAPAPETVKEVQKQAAQGQQVRKTDLAYIASLRRQQQPAHPMHGQSTLAGLSGMNQPKQPTDLSSFLRQTTQANSAPSAADFFRSVAKNSNGAGTLGNVTQQFRSSSTLGI